MKRALVSLLIIALGLFLLSSCETLYDDTDVSAESKAPSPNLSQKECEHSWERIGNLNESTARDKCTNCGEIRLYTDPESLPKYCNFSGLFKVSAVGRNTGFLDCYSRAVLDILNLGLWEREIIATEFDFIFKINGHELYYDEESGVFANFAENRQMSLMDSENDKVTSLLGDVFLVDFEVPDVLIRIEKWNGKGFEGVVADPLISYLESGDKVIVELCDGVAADEEKFPVGALVKVRFALFDASVDPDLLFAEAVTAQN